MSLGQHHTLGELTGNPCQPTGKHREQEMTRGRLVLPLGDRNRDKPEYGTDTVEERDSDPNIRRVARKSSY